MKPKTLTYVQWLAQAEQHELDRMHVLRDGRCALEVPLPTRWRLRRAVGVA